MIINIPSFREPVDKNTVKVYECLFEGQVLNFLVKETKKYLSSDMNPSRVFINAYDDNNTLIKTLFYTIKKLVTNAVSKHEPKANVHEPKQEWVPTSYVINKIPRYYNTKSKIAIFSFGDKITYGGKERETKPGSLYVFDSEYLTKRSIDGGENTVIFFDYSPVKLKTLQGSIQDRLNFAYTVNDLLKIISSKPVLKQCVKDTLEFKKRLGGGDFGNVYLSEIQKLPIAIKLARVKKESLQTPYSLFDSSWIEVNILKNIINPIVVNKICPNLPYMISSFLCDHCSLKVRNNATKYDCVSIVLELASGTLRKFLASKPKEEELYSAIFQIMAGLSAIQKHGQIMNYDVKLDNILYFNVKKGGCWEYTILNKKYYVPNYGKVFILNDFGISRCMSVKWQTYKKASETTFRLGHRYAMVIRDVFSPFSCVKQFDAKGMMEESESVTWKEDAKNVRLEASTITEVLTTNVTSGVQFRLNRETQKVYDPIVTFSKKQTDFLKENNIPVNITDKNFFLYPEIIPPFEYYNDTQDAIRMLIGGKRTTQRGNHKRHVLSDVVYEKLKLYLGPGESLDEQTFSKDPAQLLACYFIKSFFNGMYSTPKRLEILESYSM